MLIVMGTLKVPPSDLSDFIAEFETLAAAVRRRDGALAYETAVVDRARGRLLVAERWHDQTSLDAHLRADDTMAFMSRWSGRMTGEVRKYDVTKERELSVT